MDALKFAFDTLIVGALALPWLWLFMRIFFQRSNGEPPLKFPLIDALSESTRQAVAGVLILAVGYLLGSAVSRISSDFFDDKEILHELPTQSSIRQGVYLHEYCDVHSVLLAREPPAELFELPHVDHRCVGGEVRQLLRSYRDNIHAGRVPPDFPETAFDHALLGPKFEG